MSDTKHTPGPWIIATSNSWRRILSESGATVCEPTKQSDGHPDLLFPNGGQDGPDARLIAAAPALLEALESAIHIIELQYEWEMITAEDGETYEMFSGLRKDMPTYMRELDSTTGTTPKEIDETLRELKSALAIARA